MKKLFHPVRAALALLLMLSLCVPLTVCAAEPWPKDVNIEAEGGILMDADSGAVLYGKNIHEHYYPASITKILTALVVLDHCGLDETVTFSHDAVYNVEKGSTSAGYDTGDQITVRQAMYVLLLKSANEVANALGEHCAGSMDKFADMMNAKAKELGCRDSHFANPSGLNDPNHYTSPYDFALISRAAYSNPTFVEFDSATYYELPPNAKNKKAFTVYCGHKMLKKNTSSYYQGIIGGKTGYTTLAGNTLVTCAQRDGLKLIAVILNGHQTHYTDTKTLLDYGFNNFRNQPIDTHDSKYTSPEENLNLTGNSSTVFRIADNHSVTLPKNASFKDASSRLVYDYTEKSPQDAVARIDYSYGDHSIGSTWLLADTSAAMEKTGNSTVISTSAPKATPGDAGKTNASFSVPHLPGFSGPLKTVILIAAAAVVLFLLYLLLKLIIRRKEARELDIAREVRRKKRLESGISDDILRDSAASVNSYLRDSRSRKKKKGGLFRRHNKT